jgi:hypothetical protein
MEDSEENDERTGLAGFCEKMRMKLETLFQKTPGEVVF